MSIREDMEDFRKLVRSAPTSYDPEVWVARDNCEEWAFKVTRAVECPTRHLGRTGCVQDAQGRLAFGWVSAHTEETVTLSWLTMDPKRKIARRSSEVMGTYPMAEVVFPQCWKLSWAIVDS